MTDSVEERSKMGKSGKPCNANTKEIPSPHLSSIIFFFTIPFAKLIFEALRETLTNKY